MNRVSHARTRCLKLRVQILGKDLGERYSELILQSNPATHVRRD